MKKLTFEEIKKLFSELNQQGKKQYAVMVVSQSNFDKEYSLESRSYIFHSDNKMFQPNAIAYSLFMSSLDGVDRNVRYDYYRWNIDYCYLVDRNELPDWYNK